MKTNIKNKILLKVFILTMIILFFLYHASYAADNIHKIDNVNMEENLNTEDNKNKSGEGIKKILKDNNPEDEIVNDELYITEIINTQLYLNNINFQDADGIKEIKDYVRSNSKFVKYVDFKKIVEEGKIVEVYIDDKQTTIHGKTKNDTFIATINPKDNVLNDFLLTNDVSIIPIKKGVNETSYTDVIISIITVFFLISVIALVIKNNKESVPIGKKEVQKSEAKVLKDITFKDLKGVDEVKKDMSFIVDFLKNPDKYQEMGARMPKGIIFYGPPGTGKTLTARAIAGEAGVPFFSVSGSDFVEKYVGVGAKRVRELYSEAKKNSPCIVFIDEIDAVGKSRGMDENSERDQTINALLAELDGFDKNDKIITIAATNRIEMLDDALIRPGRFDKHLAIPLPDKHSRYEILKLHAKNKKLSKEINLKDIASSTVGFSGAGLESLLNEAAFLAVINNKKSIEKEEIDRALMKQLIKGDIKEGQSYRDKKELELVAWHEAGHALLTKLLTNDEVPKVTILSTTSGAGGVTFSNPEEVSLYSKKYIESKIMIMYGGRVAEYLLLKDSEKITTGASNDIQQATRLIKQYITYYGMSDKFGMINIDELFGSQASQLGANEKILNESVSLSNNLYNQTIKILKNNYDLLKNVANELLIKETLNDNDLNKIINQYKINL